jgi:hypothetical protein
MRDTRCFDGHFSSTEQDALASFKVQIRRSRHCIVVDTYSESRSDMFADVNHRAAYDRTLYLQVIQELSTKHGLKRKPLPRMSRLL